MLKKSGARFNKCISLSSEIYLIEKITGKE